MTHISPEISADDILVVDDKLENLRIVEAQLKEQGFKVRCVSNGKTAIAIATNKPPELMLLDVMMPDMDGYEVCRILKSRPETSGFPIIFLTALTETESLVEGFDAGGVGFLSKPVRQEELLAHVRTHVELYRARKVIQQHSELLEHRVAERTAELRETNRQLRESQAFNQTLLNSSPDIIYIHDIIEKMYVYSNEGVMKVLGYSVQEVRDMGEKLLPSLVHPEDYELYKKEVLPRYQKLENEELIEHEYRMKHKEGMWRRLHSKEFVFKRTPDGRPEQIFGIIRDITALKKVEEERIKLESQLHQAQKMEAIGTLAGGIAHDFNNILTMMLGYTELALDDVSEGGDFYSFLNEVMKAGRRAVDLVDQILTFSRKQETELKPLRIHLGIKEALKLLRSSMPSTIEIRQSIDPNCGLVMADPTKIHQIVMNLCTNAYHAMKKSGGTMHVNLRPFKHVPGNNLPGETELKPGSWLELMISDNGCGIPEDHLEKIFDPYFTTKEKGEGTGLGLAIVRSITEGFDGAISVESELGKGTSFHIFLPVIEADVKGDATSKDKPLPKGNERILFVDDEKRIITINNTILKGLGYAFSGFSDSLSALEAFKSAPDNFDLIITDMTMPKMTGKDLAREALEIRPDIPIILCTGHSEIISPNGAKAIGIRYYAKKPILKRELAEMVRKVLDENKGEEE